MRRLLICALVATIIPCITHAQDLCGKAFNEYWIESTNPRLNVIAEEFLPKITTKYAVIFCEGRDDPNNFVISNIPFIAEYPKVIFIGIDGYFMKTYPQSIRAVVAHELAHYATAEGRLCNTFYGPEQLDESISCEIAVDALAVKWTSSFEVLWCLQNVWEMMSDPARNRDPQLQEALIQRMNAIVQ